eukprot:c53089_g1_i1.p1 GENE.c53089_g1_i1~~c53089_g1_i1.p1  ORF type:complete len:164 (-),score=41.43 c53089_g1_i1:177-635(-)
MTQAFRDTFRLLDSDKDGFISRGELHSLFNKIGQRVTDKDIDYMLQELGTPGRSGLSFEEFMAMLGDWLANKNSQQILSEVYSTFKNAAGKVMLADMRTVLESFGERLSDEEFAELIKGVEVAADGSLSLEAFTRVLAKEDGAGPAGASASK